MSLKSASQADSFLFLGPKNLFIFRQNFDYASMKILASLTTLKNDSSFFAELFYEFLVKS